MLMGTALTIYKNEEEHDKDRDGNMQNQPRMHPQNIQHPQLQNTQCTKPQNIQQSFDIPDRYAEHIHLRKEWEDKIERLNKKYNFDYYPSSESESDSDIKPDYRYEHKYETLI